MRELLSATAADCFAEAFDELSSFVMYKRTHIVCTVCGVYRVSHGGAVWILRRAETNHLGTIMRSVSTLFPAPVALLYTIRAGSIQPRKTEGSCGTP